MPVVKKNFRGWSRLALSLALLLFLAGCALDTPTQLTSKRAEVHAGNHDARVLTADFNAEMAQAVSAHYQRYGSGPVAVTVTYDPHSRSHTAQSARADAIRIEKALRAGGVTDVQTDILPVVDAAPQTLLRYGTYTAHAPSGCGNMELIHDRGVESYRDYRLGCTTETYLARQLSRPSDLLGRDGIDDPDGRRLSNILDRYKTGEPNPVLQGLSPTN